MDPVALILSALTAGAVAALQETAGMAIKDGYKELVALLKKRFLKDKKSKTILESHAKDPEIWKKPLEKLLQDNGVADDLTILSSAKKLLKVIEIQKSGSKYEVEIKGDLHGMVLGDHAKVTMNFENTTKKKKKK
jgi:hypothetical protein